MAKKEERGEVKNPTGERLMGALKFARERLKLSETLVSAPPFSDDWATWRLATLGGIKELFGEGSDEYLWIKPSPQLPIVTTLRTPPDYVARKEAESYDRQLRGIRNGLNAIVEKYAALGPLPDFQDNRTIYQRTTTKAFISHGGFKPSLQHIQDFLRAMGVDPVIAERKESEGREVHENVDKHRSGCHFAIVLWTKDMQDTEGRWHPSGSVMMEAGELRAQFGPHIIFLKEEAVSLPAMSTTIVYEPFAEDDLGPAFRKIVTELCGWGWLQVAPQMPTDGENRVAIANAAERQTPPVDQDVMLAEEGVWDWLAQVEESMATANQETSSMGQAITSMTKSLEARTANLKELVEKGNAAGVRSSLAATAITILDYAKDTEARTPRLREAWEQFGSAANALAGSPISCRPENEDGLRSFLTSLDGLIPSFDVALDGINSMKSSMESTKGFSRDLNFASDRTVKALNSLAGEIAYAKEICVGVRSQFAAALSTG